MLSPPPVTGGGDGERFKSYSTGQTRRTEFPNLRPLEPVVYRLLVPNLMLEALAAWYSLEAYDVQYVPLLPGL